MWCWQKKKQKKTRNYNICTYSSYSVKSHWVDLVDVVYFWWCVVIISIFYNAHKVVVCEIWNAVEQVCEGSEKVLRILKSNASLFLASKIILQIRVELLWEYILAGIWVDHCPKFWHHDPVGSNVFLVSITSEEFASVIYITWGKREATKWQLLFFLIFGRVNIRSSLKQCLLIIHYPMAHTIDIL